MDNLLLRRRMMTAPTLPIGYTKLEWIGSTGTQWLNTLVSGASITRFKFKGYCRERVDNVNSQFIGGTNYQATSFYGISVISGVASWYGTSGSVLSSSWVTVNLDTNSGVGTIVDETNHLIYPLERQILFPSSSIILFGGDMGRRSPDAKCSYLQLYTSVGLAFNGIAAMRNSDQEIGMWDTVSKTFFTNSGSNSFVWQ